MLILINQDVMNRAAPASMCAQVQLSKEFASAVKAMLSVSKASTVKVRFLFKMPHQRLFNIFKTLYMNSQVSGVPTHPTKNIFCELPRSQIAFLSELFASQLI